MQVCLHPNVRAFLARAEPWLKRTEIEHAMPLQSAYFARANDSHFQKPLYWATVEEGDEVVGCAFRTPPYRLGLTALPPPAIPLLVESVAAVYGTLSGVAGTEPTASAFTEAWAQRQGATWSVRARQNLLVHKAIVPTAAPPRGGLRLAAAADAPHAAQWGAAFARESGLTELDGAVCLRLIQQRWLYFWDDGAPRCMLGVLREAPDAAAIGIVYTPPDLRGRGYATAAIAAFSRHLLERGVARSYACIDPTNAAAHSICLGLGYGLVQSTVDIDFIPA